MLRARDLCQALYPSQLSTTQVLTAIVKNIQVKLQTMTKEVIILLFPLLSAVTFALQCEIPGKCTGELIGISSQNSSVECLSSCKGSFFSKLSLAKFLM